MKKKYTVKFFYGTDLRWQETIEATNEIAALTIAEQSLPSRCPCWITEAPFRIEIAIKS